MNASSASSVDWISGGISKSTVSSLWLGLLGSASTHNVRWRPCRSPCTRRKRLSFAGAVDADGHILEPPDLWETYLEAKYRDRALRLVPDENGLEELEIGGARSRMSRRGFPSTLGAMGDPDLPLDAARPGPHLSGRGAVRQHGPR